MITIIATTLSTLLLMFAGVWFLVIREAKRDNEI